MIPENPIELMLTTVGGITGVLAISLCFLLVARLVGRAKVEFETHWGGLGGGKAGWRLSNGLALMLGVFLLSLVSLASFSAAAVAQEAAEKSLSDQFQELHTEMGEFISGIQELEEDNAKKQAKLKKLKDGLTGLKKQLTAVTGSVDAMLATLNEAQSDLEPDPADQTNKSAAEETEEKPAESEGTKQPPEAEEDDDTSPCVAVNS